MRAKKLSTGELEAVRAASAVYQGPKSVCSCGHDGDGNGSRHVGEGFSPGHGACAVAGCSCVQFTWAGMTPEYATAMELARKGVK